MRGVDRLHRQKQCRCLYSTSDAVGQAQRPVGDIPLLPPHRRAARGRGGSSRQLSAFFFFQPCANVPHDSSTPKVCRHNFNKLGREKGQATKQSQLIRREHQEAAADAAQAGGSATKDCLGHRCIAVSRGRVSRSGSSGAVCNCPMLGSIEQLASESRKALSQLEHCRDADLPIGAQQSGTRNLGYILPRNPLEMLRLESPVSEVAPVKQSQCSKPWQRSSRDSMPDSMRSHARIHAIPHAT